MGSAPFTRLEAFDVLVPAGTPITSPIETITSWNPGELVGLTIIIPPGHNAKTGLRLLLAHGQTIPTTQGAWIIGNPRELNWDTVGYPNSGAWSVQAYNTDRYDHTFHLEFQVADLNVRDQLPPEQLQPTPLLV